MRVLMLASRDHPLDNPDMEAGAAVEADMPRAPAGFVPVAPITLELRCGLASRPRPPLRPARRWPWNRCGGPGMDTTRSGRQGTRAK
jgi:hypothetical protein